MGAVDPGGPLVARVHPDAQRSASPFLEQQPAVRRYVDAWIGAWSAGERAPHEDDRPIRVMLDPCRDVIRRIRRDTGQTGGTVSLTFKLQRLGEIIDRLEAMLDLADQTRPPAERGAAWVRFFRMQIRACSEETSVRTTWRRSTELAALQITEHAGRAGEHYIAADRAEWWATLASIGRSPASPEKAALLLGQLDPLGPTRFYAAIAGVCLFLAGVVSGYCDNLVVFHHLSRRVARMPLLLRTIGVRRAEAVGAYVEHNFGALVGNFLFGCMLSGVTLLGTLSGAPLDIRHVAFASANLGVAAATLRDALGWHTLAFGALGVALIAVVNLAVSFTLSLMRALRARKLEVTGIGALWGMLVQRALSRPLDLVRPPAAMSSGSNPLE